MIGNKALQAYMEKLIDIDSKNEGRPYTCSVRELKESSGIIFEDGTDIPTNILDAVIDLENTGFIKTHQEDRVGTVITLISAKDSSLLDMAGIENVVSDDYMDSWERTVQSWSESDVCVSFLNRLNQASRDSGAGRGHGLGWYLTVSSGTGIGKSIYAINQSAKCLSMGQSVAFASLEMSHAQLAGRFWSVASGVPIKDLEPETFDSKQWEKAKESCSDWADFFVPSNLLVTLKDVETFAQRCYEKAEQNGRPLGLLVLDYLQLIQPGRPISEIHVAVTQIVGAMRSWGESRNVTVLGLSQLNLATTANLHTKPDISGLYGSNYIGQSSDQVILYDHSRMERYDDPYSSGMKTWLLLAKNRHGPSAIEVPIRICYKTLRITEADRSELSSWPGNKTGDA